MKITLWGFVQNEYNSVVMYFYWCLYKFQRGAVFLLGLFGLDFTNVKVKFFPFENVAITTSTLARS